MQRNIMLVLTLMLAGRAMTLIFIHRVGDGYRGDPPNAWLMPLLGDAIIGITALFVAYLIVKKTGLWVWTSIVVWNVVAIWDALSAYVVYVSNPWPEFFMIRIFGPGMFFAASFLHVMIIVLACRSDVRQFYLRQCSCAKCV